MTTRILITQGEADIKPDRVLDNCGREAMTAVAERSRLDILPDTPLSRLVSVTMPPLGMLVKPLI
jgi:hypothetical protein